MDDSLLTTAISKFVERATLSRNGNGRPMTVNDLRLRIRDVRMSEVSDWSNNELDMMEAHAVRFGANTPLESILQHQAEQAHADNTSLSWINSPSPFAWT